MVGVLESRKPPTPAVVAAVASACRVAPGRGDAPRRSHGEPRGRGQVVARSVETAAQARGTRVRPGRILSAHGTAPLPPVAATTWRRSAGPTTRSSTGPRGPVRHGRRRQPGRDRSQGPVVLLEDHGEPFASIFARYNHDFYAVDPHLFSPAEVIFQNVETGRSLAFGRVDKDKVLAKSFWGLRPSTENVLMVQSEGPLIASLFSCRESICPASWLALLSRTFTFESRANPGHPE